MRLRRFVNKVRDSQFYVPSLFIVASLALVYVTNALDGSSLSGPVLIRTEASAAQTLLATVAGSIITVAALVFSLSAVTVQLAANQYSPRVVHGFLRNRFQQVIVGVVMGTFTYALTALATISSVEAVGRRVDWTASVAVVLGLVAALSIVAYPDHITRRVRIDDTIRRIARRTTRTLERAKPGSRRHEESWNLAPGTQSVSVRADRAGFVQGLDVDGVIAALPSGAVARFDTWIGQFVSEGHRLFTVWSDGSAHQETQERALLGAVTIAESRSVEDDAGFGIRQLVDIALRALSPGINDPATAAEVVSHLGTCFRTAFRVGAPDRMFVGESGARLSTPHAQSPSQRADRAYTPIRRAAEDQPLVLEAIIASVSALDDELSEDDRSVPILRELVEICQSDLDRILRRDPQAH